MKSSTFPQWKGFEFSPRGCLLEQWIDLTPEIGFAYERSCEYYKDFHAHDRLMLVCPRGSSSMEVRTRHPVKTFAVDSTGILIVPKGLVHDDQSTSSIYDTLAIYPTSKEISAAAKRLGLKPADLDRFTKDCRIVKRTKKLEMLIQEYFFERVLGKRSNEDTDYLARKILYETLAGVFPDTRTDQTSSRENEDEPILQKALKFIETNLFEDFETGEIARHVGTSASTLLRKFRTELKLSPYAYIRKRRLEEAHRLLKSGQHPVSDVALLVGYENLGAFSEAFKAAYGKTPSQVRALT